MTVASPPVEPGNTQPVALVLRALYLGDMITGLPALRMLRAALPAHRIVLAAPPTAGSLALLAGTVDELTPALELAELTDAPRAADVAIDLHGNGPESQTLLERTGARRIVSYHGGDHVWKAEEHEVARWCRLVEEAFGPAREDRSDEGAQRARIAAKRGPEPVDGRTGARRQPAREDRNGGGAVLPAIAAPGQPTTATSSQIGLPWPQLAGSLPMPEAIPGCTGLSVIHPGAKARSRQWPPARYVQLTRRLIGEGHRVVVTGGPGEQQLANDIADRAGVIAATTLALPQLLALVAHARLVVCGDTGVAHIASVYATPSVVLFGPVSPALWGPPPDGPHRALWPAPPDYRGDPHADVPDPVLLRTSVDDVLAAVELTTS